MEKTPSSNLVQGSIKASFKSKESYPQKAKGLSFFAFVFSIFIYISIFYIFNLSPSKLFNNTKFWFFISNTLILIIAMDYGSFSSSSSKHTSNIKHDVYEEYVVMRRNRSVPAFFPSASGREITTTKVGLHDQEEVKKDISREKRSKAGHQRKLSVVHEGDVYEKPAAAPHLNNNINNSSSNGNPPGKIRLETSASNLDEAYRRERKKKKKKVVAKTLQRSKSESCAKRVMFDESKNIIRRIETEKYNEPQDHADPEKNEYANMSNEELNKRVEDFIQRFNKQIRLQGQVYSRN